MDPGLQDVQGKAERVKPTELRRLLDDFFREKTALRDRHVANAAVVGQYDRNNAYQYVIAREETQLSWVRDALSQLDAALGAGAAPPAERSAGQDPRGADTAGVQRDDPGSEARDIEEFVARWRARIAPMSNARQKLMLELTLGEMQEQARLFSQASGGAVDMLGHRTGGPRTEGRVLSTRWVE